jgi:hypothetical protein
MYFWRELPSLTLRVGISHHLQDTLMQFLRNLFGKPDPTRQWPRLVDQPMPMLDLSRPAFGSMIFKEGIEAAEFLGRPLKSTINARTTDLDYPGFQLGFEDNQFADVTVYFKVYPDRAICPELKFTNGLVVTPATTKDELTARLGNEYDAEQWEKYDVLQYTFGNLIVEYIFDDDHVTLDQLHAYLNYM